MACEKRGWINGGWIGLIYGIVVLILKVLLLGTANFSPLLLFMDFCLGCMGGICGVNGSLYYYKRKKEYKMGRY
ncbi:MAG: hypothetical protein XD50_0484 [Clostridia bacterium 41_269]|nr:MAG: hypothetical protein XD50_0484 [Clostridia bacterium 41_269]